MMVALVIQPTLVAMGRQRQVTVAWALGAVVFLAVLVAPVHPVVAALVAQLVGPGVVLVVLGFGVVRALRAANRTTGLDTVGDRLTTQAVDTEGP
jgi:O-antigen/teichoic acid export membrane protein